MPRSIPEMQQWLVEAEQKFAAAKRARLEKTDELAFRRAKISVQVRAAMLWRMEREERRRLSASFLELHAP